MGGSKSQQGMMGTWVGTKTSRYEGVMKMQKCECGCNTFTARITDGDQKIVIDDNGEIINVVNENLETKNAVCVVCGLELVSD